VEARKVLEYVKDMKENLYVVDAVEKLEILNIVILNANL